jgi:hypothetical protein
MTVCSGLAADSIDVTLVEAVELLQDDLRVLRAHVIEVMDDYQAVRRRSAELSAEQDQGTVGPGSSIGVDELTRTLAELASVISGS